MPPVIIGFLIYAGWVGLSTAADELPQKHEYNCIKNYQSDRVHWDVPGWRFAIPWPFRKGKTRYDYQPGDVDECTSEKFNGSWWYKP